MVRAFVGLSAWFMVTLATGAIGASADESRGDVARGGKFYSDNCMRCHNARAPKEHRDRDWSIVMTHMRVTAGLPGQQARDIQAFLYASNNPPRPTLPVRRAAAETVSGADLIEQYACRGCHMIGGSGGTLAPKLDNVFERRTENWIRVQIAHPREHNPQSVMPDFGLADDQVQAILEALKRAR